MTTAGRRKTNKHDTNEVTRHDSKGCAHYEYVRSGPAIDVFGRALMQSCT